MLSQRKLVALHNQAQRVLRAGLPGDFAEIGVHRGGASAILAALVKDTDRAIHLFDRWGDLPEPGPEDGPFQDLASHETLAEPLEEIRTSNLRKEVEQMLTWELGLPARQLVMHQGWFQETFPAYHGRPLAFSHVDADFYESMTQAFTFLEQHMADRAVLVLDDWNDWPGVRQAYEEYAATTSRTLVLEPSRGQAVVSVGVVSATHRHSVGGCRYDTTKGSHID